MLREIWFNGDDFEVIYGSESSRTRKLNLSIEIEHPENRPLVDEKAPCDVKYLQMYALQYLWLGMVEEGESYTYGGRMREPVDQIEEAIKRYSEEIQDRQVTLVIRRPEDIYKSLNGQKHEPPCLSLMDTEISGGKLHLTCYFRSWDAYAGLPANIAGLQMFNEQLASEINARAGLRLTTGKLIFHSKNCHIYSRLNSLVEELLKPGKDSRKEMIKR